MKESNKSLEEDVREAEERGKTKLRFVEPQTTVPEGEFLLNQEYVEPQTTVPEGVIYFSLF